MSIHLCSLEPLRSRVVPVGYRSGRLTGEPSLRRYVEVAGVAEKLFSKLAFDARIRVLKLASCEFHRLKLLDCRGPA